MAQKSLFGTDGVRGRANVDLTAELAMGLARAAGDGRGGTAVIGRDTRRSGQMLAAAVHAGFNAAGLDTVDLGIVPVGAVAYHTREMNAAFGVMVSASHNPAGDNGIKFFGPDGSKLDDDREAAIEARLGHGSPWTEVSGTDVGIQMPGHDDGLGEYLDHLAAQADFRLNGIEVVLDCAHGASFLAAPHLFEEIGAGVTAINVEPTGMNINDGCGAVHPEMLAAEAEGRIGLAFDGDADRCIAVDEDGMVCNGDVIMAILARHLRSRGELPGDRVVATVMSNLGFRLALRKMGIDLTETPVGDRYVLEEMRRTGAGLGGEQSGHILFRGRTTGDGLLTGMRLLEVVAATGAPLKELRRVMVEYPQVLRNVHVRVKERLADADAIWEIVARMEKRLGDKGRVLVRASGTEPLVRVMVEATESHEAAAIADDVVLVVRRELGGVFEGEG
ncbi:MAG TPA: phosphoglucosamine mutase [Acidimicrobiia bacterium]|nr:phosphoglucosamine mutase [Acidimicrobiia bacterium]